MSQQALVASPTNDTAPMSSDDILLTVSEVARHLRVDATTVRRWIAQGTLEAISLPHQGRRRVYRVRQSTLDHLLQPIEATEE